MRASGAYEGGYELRLSAHERVVELRTLHDRAMPGTVRRAIWAVDGLDRRMTLDIVLADDIIDVCIDGRRCLVSRYPELCGNRLFFFCQNGDVSFDDIEIRPLG